MISAFFRNWAITGSYFAALAALVYLIQPDIWVHFYAHAQDYFDSEHYNVIRDSGYDRLRAAFYPGFPLFWKLTHLPAWGISLVNAVLASGAIAALATHLKARGWEFWLLLSQPLLVFWCIGYSEALFSLACVAALIGLDRKDFRVVLPALMLAAFCRPLWAVFLPGFLILMAFNARDRKAVSISIVGVVATAAGSLLALWVQRLDGMTAADFFASQEQWGSFLQVPSFPLSSWSDSIAVRLDASAFAIGLSAAGYLGWRVFRKKPLPADAFSFSLLYLAGVSFLVLLFRGGEMFSLGRFVFATPFFLYALLHVSRHAQPSKKHVYWLLVPLAVALLFGVYVHISYVPKFFFLPLILLLYLWTGWLPLKGKHIARWLFAATAIALALYFWIRALTFEWIG